MYCIGGCTVKRGGQGEECGAALYLRAQPPGMQIGGRYVKSDLVFDIHYHFNNVISHAPSHTSSHAETTIFFWLCPEDFKHSGRVRPAWDAISSSSKRAGKAAVPELENQTSVLLDSTSSTSTPPR